MLILRKSLMVAITAVTLGLGAVADIPSASAHGFHGHHVHMHHGVGRVGRGHFRGHHRGYHWHHRWGGERHWHHRFGYHWGGYRRIVGFGGYAFRTCPIGTHRGYLGKHCWPNRY